MMMMQQRSSPCARSSSNARAANRHHHRASIACPATPHIPLHPPPLPQKALDALEQQEREQGAQPIISTAKPEPAEAYQVYSNMPSKQQQPNGASASNGKQQQAEPEQEAEQQRPVLSAIYPRGSVCAVVLGGGEADSRRLFPLTEKRTLPAIPLGASYRLIDIPMSCLINSGIRKIFTLTQYQSTSLNRYLQHTYELHGGMPLVGDGFLEVVAATQGPKEQRWAEGPADTVRQWWNMFSGNAQARQVEDVLVLPSDQVYKIDFEQLVGFHRHHLADLTIVCRPVEERLVDHFGIVKLGAGTAVTSFEEKPQGELKTTMSMDVEDTYEFMNEPHLSSVPFFTAEMEMEGQGKAKQQVWLGSCGIYVFRKEALDKLLRDNPRAKDFGRELIPQAIKTMKVVAYNHPDFWIDIGGSIAEFWDFNIKLAKDEIPFSFSDSQFYGARGNLPPNRIEDCKLSKVLLGSGCRVHRSTIRNSVIGTRAIVGEGCVIEDSVLMGADYYSFEKDWSRQVSATYPDIGLGTNCKLRKTIVDKNARIGHNVQLLNPEGVFESMDRIAQGVAIREGVIIVSKSAVLPDNTSV